MKISVRKVHVDDVEYLWIIDGNTIDGSADTHIAIFQGKNGQRLMLDPYSWHFEVRPSNVVAAIRFALRHGWTPRKYHPAECAALMSAFVRRTEGRR